MVMVRCLPSVLEALSLVLSVLDQFQGQEKRPPLQQKHLDEANVALDREGMLRGVTQKQELTALGFSAKAGGACHFFIGWGLTSKSCLIG